MRIIHIPSYISCQGTFTKRIPIGIEVPVAFVVTNGAASARIDGEYFSDLTDFKDTEGNVYDFIVCDEQKEDICKMNFPSGNFSGSRKDFLDSEENKSAVMLSSTMMINEFRSVMTNYEKCCVYPDTDKIECKYTYYWSIGTDPEEVNETAASERLLSWMLGNVYQNTLMVSRCSDGQIPVNQECFRTKIESKTLKPVIEIYKKFTFESEEQ